MNLLFNVTINDILVIYVTAHRCAGGLKKKFEVKNRDILNIRQFTLPISPQCGLRKE